MVNKKKIINDPVYGFLSIAYEIIFDLIEHRYFQRLRYIQQLGLSSLVYPGALHTRFHHALGATHLMKQAIDVLMAKDVDISPQEAKAVTIAILLHDIGHGPFSHALEHSLVNVGHETLSLLFMNKLNEEFEGKLSLAIQIFKGEHPKNYLHELVSSQLDMDRLDYLNRDSFFTGVQEGVIGFDRIIKMLDVRNNHLMVEYKGIYSIEQFLIARRLMYWQVYLHKTVLCAEVLLLKVLQRAKELTKNGETLFAPPALQLFLQNDFGLNDFENNLMVFEAFASLGDAEIIASIKTWQQHPDVVLSKLSQSLINRKLFKIHLTQEPVNPEKLQQLLQKAIQQYHLTPHEAAYFVFNNSTSNSAYSYEGSQINILYRNGVVKNVVEASDYSNLQSLAAPVVKYYLCYPKELD
ncbi:HD domain-containing protein [Sphingobacteriales bacterium UPWRP_1]|nr:phosphohydrolase [Sphingobacteriales bacterium TSM_CSS]PSJ72555.1 HD domain-containing protein [Sphingobacteriales bacterium UPWRP_1]